MKIIAAIRQYFCRHTWQTTKFQALVPGMSYECTKCGKHERFYCPPPKGAGR